MKKTGSFIFNFLKNRLDERSTWRGLIAIFTIFGLSLSPEQTESIIAAGIALGALLEVFFPENGEGKIGQSMKKEKAIILKEEKVEETRKEEQQQELNQEEKELMEEVRAFIREQKEIRKEKEMDREDLFMQNT